MGSQRNRKKNQSNTEGALKLRPPPVAEGLSQHDAAQGRNLAGVACFIASKQVRCLRGCALNSQFSALPSHQIFVWMIIGFDGFVQPTLETSRAFLTCQRVPAQDHVEEIAKAQRRAEAGEHGSAFSTGLSESERGPSPRAFSVVLGELGPLDVPLRWC